MRRIAIGFVALVTFMYSGLLDTVFAAQFKYTKPRSDKVILIFIPGIFGSKLFNSTSEEWHWGVEDYGSRGLSLLDFPEFEVSLLEQAEIPFLGFRITRNVYSDFKQHGRWVAGDVLSFPYDWRKSNRTTAQAFDDWLCKMLPPLDKNVRLVFVAHSMGGLVLRHWLNEYLEPKSGCDRVSINRIDKFVFAGTPHFGSVEPVESLYSGRSAITEQPFFSLLFTDNIVRDALTFESTYELLPAFNVVNPECDIANPIFSEKLIVHSDTATSIELELWNRRHWEDLEIPRKLPLGMERNEALELIDARLKSASKNVCALLTHAHPAVFIEKMAFLAGSKTKRNKKALDTLSEIAFRVAVGRTPAMQGKKALGDGTVPSWSSVPPWEAGKAEFSSIDAYHDGLLSNSDAKLIIERMLKISAATAATEAGQLLIKKPKDKAELRDALIEFSALSPAGFDPFIYEKVVDQFSIAATEANIDGNELYDLANNYEGVNRSTFRALGFSLAARDEWSLNNERQFWAHQNSAFAFLQLGASELSLRAASNAGIKNIVNFGEVESKEFLEFDSKWRSVAARNFEQLGVGNYGQTIVGDPIRSLPEFLNRIPSTELYFATSGVSPT